MIVAVADQAPINCRIGGEHADALGGGKAVVNLAHGGDKVGLDGRLTAQDLGGVAPDLGDLVEGNVFGIFVAVKNGLIKRIAAFQHLRASPLSELRIADQLDVELAIGALPVIFVKDDNRVVVEQSKHSGMAAWGAGWAKAASADEQNSQRGDAKPKAHMAELLLQTKNNSPQRHRVTEEPFFLGGSVSLG